MAQLEKEIAKWTARYTQRNGVRVLRRHTFIMETPGEPPLTPVITPANDLFNAGAEAFTETTSKLRVSDDPSERLVDLLRMSGGEVFGGQRTFAKAIGISPAYVNGLLHDLKAAGKVALNVGKNGTRVRLVA
jgi:hypothetical protein